MAVYRYKLSFDKFPTFLREYEVKETNTLYQLHRCIQNDLDFDDAQLAVFYSSDKSWGKKFTYPLFDMGEGSMDMITISMLVEKNIKCLLYTFDLYNDRSFKLELLDKTEEQRLVTYPRVVAIRNDPPDQLMDNDPIADLPFLNDSTIPPSTDELEDLDDEDDDDSEDDDEVEEFFEDSVGQ